MSEKIVYPIDETLSDVVNNRCPILHAMQILGSKWKLPILWYLHEKENTRYNELKRRIFKSDPPQIVEYSLTTLGLELLPALNELYKWGSKHLSDN